MEELKAFENKTDSLDVLYTIIVYDTSVETFLKDVENKLNSAKKISNPMKKHKISQRLFALKNNIEEKYSEPENILNMIILVDEDVHIFPISTTMIQTSREYGLKRIYEKVDTFFHIPFIVDFFTNFHFIYHLKLVKNSLTLVKMNKNKEKEVENRTNMNENSLTEYCNKIRNDYQYKDILFFSGNSNLLQKIAMIKNTFIKNEPMSKNEVWEQYEKEEMKKNLMELEKRMNDMSNPKNIDLYVFGKLKEEIKDAMESYQLKELFIEEKKLKKLKEFVSSEYFNFKIYPIESLEPGDIGSQFIQSYNGIMGIKYY